MKKSPLLSKIWLIAISVYSAIFLYHLYFYIRMPKQNGYYLESLYIWGKGLILVVILWIIYKNHLKLIALVIVIFRTLFPNRKT